MIQAPQWKVSVKCSRTFFLNNLCSIHGAAIAKNTCYLIHVNLEKLLLSLPLCGLQVNRLNHVLIMFCNRHSMLS